MCSVCIANGERHHNHAVISTKDAAGEAQAAVEGYVKQAQGFAKEAEGHSKALSAMQGSSTHPTATTVDFSLLFAE